MDLLSLALDRPIVLVLLLLLPVGWIARRLRTIRSNRDLQRVGVLVLPKERVRRARWQTVMTGLLLAALTCAVAGSASIRTAPAGDVLERPAREIVVALDVSKSMLAADVQPSRLREAIRQLRDAVRPGPDASVAVVAFAGDGVLACPITVDSGAVDAVLQQMETPPPNGELNGGLPGGSSLAAGLARALSALPRTSTASQTIVLVSDGEDTAGRIDEILPALVERRVAVHVVAVGSSAGAPVPIGPASDAGMQKDAGGAPVISRMSEEALKEIATRSAGTFRVLEPGRSSMRSLMTDLARAPSADGSREREEWLSRTLFAIALLLVTAESALALSGIVRGGGGQ